MCIQNTAFNVVAGFTAIIIICELDNTFGDIIMKDIPKIDEEDDESKSSSSESKFNITDLEL